MSHTNPQKPKLAAHRRRHLGRQVLDSWPLLVWLAMLFVTVWAYRRGGSFRQMNGTVGVYQEAISPDDTGRLMSVEVEPGVKVEPGDLLARMDTSIIDREIALVKRQIEVDWQDRIRRYEGDVAAIESDLADLELDRASDESELRTRLEDLKVLEADLASGAIPIEDVADARASVSGIKARVERYGPLINTMKDRLNSAKGRLQKLLDEDPEAGANNQQQEELLMLQTLKANMELRAVHAGVVYRVEKERGEIVLEGETVVRVVARPENIIGFLPQEQIGAVEVGDQVWVSSTANRHAHFPSEIVSISPRMSSTPDVASPLPNKMLFGREITVKLPEEAEFLPGQTVIIHLEEPGRLPFVGWFSKGPR
jgi:HlyD family secretion protein